MFLKLFDENAVTRLVNVGMAQSIEEYIEPEEEKEDETPEIFKTGIRIIWNEQIDSEDSKLPSYFSEQLFFGISFAQLQQLMILNQLYIQPAKQPAASNGTTTAKPLVNIKKLETELIDNLEPEPETTPAKKAESIIAHDQEPKKKTPAKPKKSTKKK